MALELNRLTGQVGRMGEAMAEREREHTQRVQQARATLRRRALVTQDLRDKITLARRSDASWRGADPLSECLDERHVPDTPGEPATLVAVDGSQIYPDRHSIATYYLVNVGSIVLRQGTGQAPDVGSSPEIHFEDSELYDDAGHLVTPEFVNRERSRKELDMLVQLAEAERMALGGDLGRPLLMLSDGPLLPWQPPRKQSGQTNADGQHEFEHFVEQLDRLNTLHAIPLGYVDRPSSANLLRTLELTGLPAERITRRTVRHGDYRLLTDRLLMADLGPNERTGLFASTSELNERLREKGPSGSHRVSFFYINMARRADLNPIIARVELPAWDWLVTDTTLLDVIQQALYADAALTGYPYVLARAHEMAVVGNAERSNLEAMLQSALLRCGLQPSTSRKAENKRFTGSKRR